MEEQKQFKQYLKELRNKILIALVPALIIATLSLVYIKQFLVKLINYYGLEGSVVALTPYENIGAIMNLSFGVFIITFIPLFIYQLVMFSKDAFPNIKVKKANRKITFFGLITIAGFIFGITILSKLFFNGMSNYTIAKEMWSLGSVLSLVSLFGTTMAVSIQMIWVIPFMSNNFVIDKKNLNNLRPLLIISILIISALITPPYILSQMMMFIPIYASYEIGMLLSKRKKEVTK